MRSHYWAEIERRNSVPFLPDNIKITESTDTSTDMFENYVISEIIKRYATQGIDTRSRLCYYRDNTGEGAIICMAPMVVPLDDNNKLVPVRCI